MWARVTFTHRRGVKLGQGQQHPRGLLEGELVSYVVGQRRLEAVALKASFHTGPDLAVLYRPRLVGIGLDNCRIAGLEHVGTGTDGAWVHQEWICLLEARPVNPAGEPSRERRP